MNVSLDEINGVEILTLQNQLLRCSIAPSLGGKVTSLFNKKLGKEFLWTNDSLPLQKNNPGSDYDSNFFGGIDELLPNDLPEAIDGINFPDHGELWTQSLDYSTGHNGIQVQGLLPLSKLHYTRSISLLHDSPTMTMEYRIKNTSENQRKFLWKMHAALKITPGDRMNTDAVRAQVADLDYSRFASKDPFQWPFIQNVNASVVPDLTDAMDFLYLYDMATAEQGMLATDGALFRYRYDKKVFPYQWYFASYGGFRGHQLAILEPCTSMPMSVNEAYEKKQCTVLQPGEELYTTVSIFAGENDNNA